MSQGGDSLVLSSQDGDTAIYNLYMYSTFTSWNFIKVHHSSS